MDKRQQKKKSNQAVCEMLKNNKLILNISGFWPTENFEKSIIPKIKIIVIAFLFITMTLLNFIIMFVIKTSDSVYSIANVFDAASLFVLSFQITMILLHRDKITEVLEESECLLNIERSQEELEIIKIWKKRQARVIKFYDGLIASAVVLYLLGPILSNKKNLPLGVNLPSILYQSPWYQIIYTSESAIILFGNIFSFSWNVILVTFFVMHLCCELECTAMNIKKFGRDKRKSFVKDTVKRHVAVLAYGKNVINLIAIPFYFNLIYCMIWSCASGFTVLVNIDPVLTLRSFFILIVTVCWVFHICCIGQIILLAYFKVTDSLINSKWYEIDIENRKDVLMIILQAQNPLQLRVGRTLGNINFEGFKFFMFNLYSYLNIINLVLKKKN